MNRLFAYALLFLCPLCGWGQTVHLQMPARDTIHIAQLSIRPFATWSSTTRNTIPANLYTTNFGFFCRQELKMYKAHVPVSFRLGSMQYCDMLEGKGRK